MSEANENDWPGEASVCKPRGAAGTNYPATPLTPELEFPPDPQLVAQGWQRRFMADAVRAREARTLYGEMGYEVRLEPIKPTELSEACGECRVATCLAYITVYTRKVNIAQE